MRNRLIKVLFLPIAIFLWMVGWAMFWTSTRREHETQQTQEKISPEDESITIIPLTHEEPEQCEA